jgi:hypothetical protein
MRINRCLLALGLLVGLCCAAQAKDVDLQKLPGYVDLEKIQIPGSAEEVMDVDLGPALLKLALGADENRDQALSQALEMVQSIRVKSFSVDENQAPKIQAYMKEIEEKLNADDWQRLIYIKDDEEIVIVSVKHAESAIAGLMVMVFEDDEEATFVNVVGNIDLSKLIGIAGDLDEVDIKGLLEELEGD